jgi:hypothetical protein
MISCARDSGPTSSLSKRFFVDFLDRKSSFLFQIEAKIVKGARDLCQKLAEDCWQLTMEAARGQFLLPKRSAMAKWTRNRKLG